MIISTPAADGQHGGAESVYSINENQPKNEVGTMADKKKKERAVPVRKVTDDEKKAALEAALAHIEKNYGKGAVMRLGAVPTAAVDVIPTGSMTHDMALGVGGLPKGRIIELFGAESSGKTTLALHCIAEAQKRGGEVAFIDVEHALDPVYAKALGVDIDNMLVSQPDSGEQALDITEELVRSGAIDMIVVDSVAALTTKSEIDGAMGDSHVGMLARLMSQAMRKLTSVISRTSCVAIFINQVREKIGISYGNPEVTPGGRALKFYSSVRIQVSAGQKIKIGDSVVGNITKCTVKKNKVAPPFKECEFDIIYGKGIDRMGEIIDIAVDLKIVKKSGAWFSYEGAKIGQGREAAKKYLADNPDTLSEIEDKIIEMKDEAQKAMSDKIQEEKAKNKAAEKAAENGELDALLNEEDGSSSGGEDYPDINIDIAADDDYTEFAPEE